MSYINNRKLQLLILLILAFGVYFNTTFNEYTLDDEAVITGNRLVKKGIDGIPSLVSHHLFYGSSEHNPGLSSGLYRPLPLTTFALEYEIFGKAPHISHLLNVILFCLIVLALYLWMEKKFHQARYIPLICAALFAIHPIHTEAIANIKGRDELLSLLFILITLLNFHWYNQWKKSKYLAFSMMAYIMALFSKESSVTFVGLLFISNWFLDKKTFRECFIHSIPFIIVTSIYLIIKFKVTGLTFESELSILNYPYLYATAEEAFATKIYILFKYIGLLLFPHPLTYDYCFNHIPYIKLSDVKFIISAIALTGLLTFAIYKLPGRNIYSFAIFFFFISIFLVSNLIFRIGAPMGERFLFLPSVAFCIAGGFMFSHFLVSGSKTVRTICISTLLIIFSAASFKTISRNSDWKNNLTLFTKDVETAPNSIRTLTNAGAYSYYQLAHKAKTKEEELKLRNYSIEKLKRAIATDSSFSEPYIHLAHILFKNEDTDAAIACLVNAKNNAIKNSRLDIYFKEAAYRLNKKGLEDFKSGNLEEAQRKFLFALELDPSNADSHWYAGGIHLERKEITETLKYWNKTLELNPDYPNGKLLLETVKRDFNVK
ncbi:MAG: tetratricopeptide repeat protein [Cytophagaceae bacterium]